MCVCVCGHEEDIKGGKTGGVMEDCLQESDSGEVAAKSNPQPPPDQEH